MSLNPKQSAFCDEYLKDMNATQAAIRAGYSERTAKSQGQRLLTNVDVAARLAELKAERSQRTKIDADWLLTRLAAEAEADVADLYHENGQLRPVHEWPLIWRQGLVSGIDTVVIGDEETVTKIKVSDRIKRLELIGKHVDVQAFKERLEIDDKSDLDNKLDAARKRIEKAAKQ